MKKLKYYQLFWGVFLCVLLIDQASKYAIQLADQGGLERTFFSLGWFSLVYVQNTGAAWGMMAGSGVILGTLAVLALSCIYFLHRALQIKRVPMQVAFGLLTAGIAGNMVDRLCLGYVVDFLDFSFRGVHFPAFNIADIGITAGVLIYFTMSSMEGGAGTKAAKSKAV